MLSTQLNLLGPYRKTKTADARQRIGRSSLDERLPVDLVHLDRAVAVTSRIGSGNPRARHQSKFR
jgi:hypothetical protein